MDIAQRMDRFQEFLATRGLRLTDQRRVIASAFFGAHEHVSLLELLELSKDGRASIGYATVYRTMRLMVEGGFASEHRFGEDQTRFEVVEEGEHHDHFICLDCGHILEFEDPVIEQRQAEHAAAHGFRVLSHRHEIYVRCIAEATCLRRRSLQAQG